VESYPYPVTEGQRYINLNPGRLLLSSHPKGEGDREAHYTATREDNYRTTRQNETKYNKTPE